MWIYPGVSLGVKWTRGNIFMCFLFTTFGCPMPHFFCSPKFAPDLADTGRFLQRHLFVQLKKIWTRDDQVRGGWGRWMHREAKLAVWQGLVNVPIGDLFHITFKYLEWTFPNSWVMFNSNIYQPLFEGVKKSEFLNCGDSSQTWTSPLCSVLEYLPSATTKWLSFVGKYKINKINMILLLI